MKVARLMENTPGLISPHSTLTAERAAEPLLHSDAVSLHIAATGYSEATWETRGGT